MSPRPPVLSPEDLARRMLLLPAWSADDGRLRRRFVLEDFAAAFAFMTRVAAVAEELDHHPDWSNSWNTVDIAIRSHDAGGITDLCVQLARRIDDLA